MKNGWPRPRAAARPTQRAWPRRRIFDAVLAISILGLLALLAARLDRVATRTLEGQATVNDGDTLTLGDERIRLRGIDAPEYAQTCRRDGNDYACGREARAALAGLVSGRTAACEGWERDRYGRLLGTCKAGGRDLAAAMVEAGWAVAYGGYWHEEANARRSGAGMWAGDFDRPSHWRTQHGGMVEAQHDGLQRVFNWLRTMLRFP